MKRIAYYLIVWFGTIIFSVLLLGMCVLLFMIGDIIFPLYGQSDFSWILGGAMGATAFILFTIDAFYDSSSAAPILQRIILRTIRIVAYTILAALIILILYCRNS